jgi:hypothetical protein
MEINAGIPENYCQGAESHVEHIDLDEIQFPLEDKVKLRSVRLKRDKKKLQ